MKKFLVTKDNTQIHQKKEIRVITTDSVVKKSKQWTSKFLIISNLCHFKITCHNTQHQVHISVHYLW